MTPPTSTGSRRWFDPRGWLRVNASTYFRTTPCIGRYSNPCRSRELEVKLLEWELWAVAHTVLKEHGDRAPPFIYGTDRCARAGRRREGDSALEGYRSPRSAADVRE